METGLEYEPLARLSLLIRVQLDDLRLSRLELAEIKCTPEGASTLRHEPVRNAPRLRLDARFQDVEVCSIYLDQGIREESVFFVSWLSSEWILLGVLDELVSNRDLGGVLGVSEQDGCPALQLCQCEVGLLLHLVVETLVHL